MDTRRAVPRKNASRNTPCSAAPGSSFPNPRTPWKDGIMQPQARVSQGSPARAAEVVAVNRKTPTTRWARTSAMSARSAWTTRMNRSGWRNQA